MPTPLAADTRLPETLKTVAEKARAYRARSLNEQNTKASLIDPVLEALGWNIRDPEEVCREFKPKSRDNPVDYSLHLNRSPRLFLEAKALGENLVDRRWLAQVLQYTAVAGVPWCVLSDGDEYRLYNAGAQVDADRKLLCQVKLSDGDLDRAAKILDLISRANLQENLIQACWNCTHVDRQAKAALEFLVAETHPDLVRIIRKHAAGMAAKDVAASLRRLRVQVEAPQQFGPVAPPAARPAGERAGRPAVGRAQPGAGRAGAAAVVTLQEIIAAGLLRPPLALFREYKDRRLDATLLPDGGVEFGGRRYHTCSAAADAARQSVTGRPASTNGWDFWQYAERAGRAAPLDAARSRFRQRQGDRAVAAPGNPASGGRSAQPGEG